MTEQERKSQAMVAIPTLEETIARFQAMSAEGQAAVAEHYVAMADWLQRNTSSGKARARREVTVLRTLKDELVGHYTLVKHGAAWTVTMAIKDLGRVYWKAHQGWEPDDPDPTGYNLRVTGQVTQSTGLAARRLRRGIVTMVPKQQPISPLFSQVAEEFQNPFPKPGSH